MRHHHPAIVRLARRLGMPPYAALGLACALADWCRAYASDGPARYDPQALADAVGYDGDAWALYQALHSPGPHGGPSIIASITARLGRQSVTPNGSAAHPAPEDLRGEAIAALDRLGVVGSASLVDQHGARAAIWAAERAARSQARNRAGLAVSILRRGGPPPGWMTPTERREAAAQQDARRAQAIQRSTATHARQAASARLERLIIDRHADVARHAAAELARSDTFIGACLRRLPEQDRHLSPACRSIVLHAIRRHLSARMAREAR